MAETKNNTNMVITPFTLDKFDVNKVSLGPISAVSTMKTAKLLYDGLPFTFKMTNLRTTTGIIPNNFNPKKLNMLLPLSDEQTKELDDLKLVMSKFLFPFGSAFGISSKKLENPEQFATFVVNSFYNEGKDKPDGSGKYSDSLGGTVPSRMKGGQVVVEEEVCGIFTENCAPYAYTQIRKGTRFSEVAVRVNNVYVRNGQIGFSLLFTVLVPSDPIIKTLPTCVSEKMRSNSESMVQNLSFEAVQLSTKVDNSIKPDTENMKKSELESMVNPNLSFEAVQPSKKGDNSIKSVIEKRPLQSHTSLKKKKTS